MGERGFDEFISIVVDRAPVLAALQDGPKSRREIQSELDVSKATVHRVTTTLADLDLLERTNGSYILTQFGREMATEVTAFRDRVCDLRRLSPLLAPFDDEPELDVSALTDATVTVAAPGDPHAPVQRYLTLVRETDEFRTFDTTGLGPSNFEMLADRVAAEMRAEVVYEPAVVERLRRDCPDAFAAAVDAESIDVLVHDDLPFGLTLFDDRIGVGRYDAEVGTLRVYVDTDDPAATSWARDLYGRYRAEAVPFADYSFESH